MPNGRDRGSVSSRASPASAPSSEEANARLQRLPSVDRVLNQPEVAALMAMHGRSFVTREVRALLADRREALMRDDRPAPDEAAIAAALAARIRDRLAPKLREVFNLTGTVIHTNLGRALLAESAIEQVVLAMRAPTNLEFNLATAGRGERDSIVEELLCELTGAEAATVVNNNAAAVLLTLSALAARREVVVSRGELVEIGGSFRMPDVMASAGVRLVEVGTTNRTHRGDYTGAIGPRTALIMKVHTSNYAVRGFTAAVSEAELAQIARGAGLPFAVDLGSGSLVDLAQYGLPREPLPRDIIAQGADVVTFSGDKLMGGPQAGMIVGTRQWLDRIRKHPLKRALRVSKLTLAALEATLAHYRHPELVSTRVPTLRLLTRSATELEALAARLLPAVARALGQEYQVSSGRTCSQIGSGSLPLDVLPSVALFVRPVKSGRGEGRRLDAVAAALRALPVPVVGRIAEGALILDLRTLEDEARFVTQLAGLRHVPPPLADAPK